MKHNEEDKNTKKKKMKNPNEEKKWKEACGVMEQTKMAGREMSKEGNRQRLKKRIFSKATKAGKEQDENDSFKSGETEKKEKRGLSFNWTRTYCKRFSRPQINAFVCCVHVFLFHIINAFMYQTPFFLLVLKTPKNLSFYFGSRVVIFEKCSSNPVTMRLIWLVVKPWEKNG